MPVLYFDIVTRSEALAKQAAENLRQELGAKSAKIVSRRNAQGQFSARGHHFIAEVQVPKKKRKKEWVIKTKYKGKKGGGKGGPPSRTLLTDIRVSTPANWDRDDVQEALLDFIDGKQVKGLEVRAFDWARGKEAHAKPPADIRAMREMAAMFFSVESFDIKEEEKG